MLGLINSASQYDAPFYRALLEHRLASMVPHHLGDQYINFVAEIFVLASIHQLDSVVQAAVQAMRFGHPAKDFEGPGLWDAVDGRFYKGRAIFSLQDVDEDWVGRMRARDVIRFSKALSKVYSEPINSYSWRQASIDWFV